jgi:hypothetical protein
MRLWHWWPIRLLKWFYGFDKQRCDLSICRGPTKEQPFMLVMGNPDRKVFFWNMDISVEGMEMLIKNLQSSLDQYQEFRKG